MLYLVAFVLPPLAVLLCGKPWQALVSLVLWLLAVVLIGTLIVPLVLGPAVLGHALFVAHNRYSDKRTARIVDAMRGS